MDFSEIPDAQEEPVILEVPVHTGLAFSLPEPELDDELRSIILQLKPISLFSPHSSYLSSFNKRWNIALQEKLAAEQQAEAHTKVTASQEMANWNSQREVRLTSKKDSNRSQEQVYLESLESDSDSNNVWERVTKLIDANMDVSADSSKADTSRMRKLFIQLKNEPLELSRN